MKPQYKYNNREISWLHFNERLLQEAEDKQVPLLERINFLGIYSNNLDEFYRVRVASLNRMRSLRPKDRALFDFDPARLLKKINDLSNEHQERFQNIYQKLIKALEKHHIHIVNEKELSEEQGRFVTEFFHKKVRNNLFPVMLDQSPLEFPLKDKSIYLGIMMQPAEKHGKTVMALMKIPVSKIPRFIVLPSTDKRQTIIFLDDVIRYKLRDVFSVYEFETIAAYTFKITRDAELDIDSDASKSFLEIMAESLKKRSQGNPVRFVYDREMPESLLKTLTRKLHISRQDTIVAGGRYHNFKDLLNFPPIGPPGLRYSPLPPLPHPVLHQKRSIFSVIREKDVMLHFPYQSFRYIIDLLREASIDPNVRSIRMTLYRLAKDSNIINALINAARNGKSVTVFMEVQARFDEEANIQYIEMLQEEGVRIIRAIPGFKVHAKLLLIRRKEGAKSVYYANLATGNFNESTAEIYADDSLLTCNTMICEDVRKVFELFEANYKQHKFSSLIVSPFKMRDTFIKLLKNEIRNKKEGKEAWAVIKLNNITDMQIAETVYRAAEAGVKITMIVRGTSVLVPKVNKLGHNLSVFGVIDRFLEHSRVFVFANDGNPLFYISSADWMGRNFDNRIETAIPIYDPGIQAELMSMLEIQMADNCKARLVGLINANTYRSTQNKKKIRSQYEIYKLFSEKQIESQA
ncbi:MAG TPA: polyphosphate kinase 1 [Bacteroidales bacterium]|nr:polyphosphate kinase 1 [Bacteroidales bacterium]HSA44131.1 polyphosphate kinase 1 [Bacteroidales bacterium]